MPTHLRINIIIFFFTLSSDGFKKLWRLGVESMFQSIERAATFSFFGLWTALIFDVSCHWVTPLVKVGYRVVEFPLSPTIPHQGRGYFYHPTRINPDSPQLVQGESARIELMMDLLQVEDG